MGDNYYQISCSYFGYVFVNLLRVILNSPPKNIEIDVLYMSIIYFMISKCVLE